MPHLRGNQWRESPRAMNKKNRAKSKHFGAESGEEELIDAASEDAYDQSSVGIVVESHQGKVVTRYEHQNITIPLTGNAQKNRNALVPGDRVVIEGALGNMAITHALQRRSELVRMKRDYTRRSSGGAQEQVIAANIDTAVIVASANDPPFHPKFIDLYLVLIQRSDIMPVICLSKGDLASEDERRRIEHYKHLGITTIETSTVSGEGIDELKALLLGKMAVLVGHSGVGKTSLINAIDPDAAYRTGVVGQKTGKGRHTTTASVLHEWDDDSYIIDTPGIRSLEVWDIDPPELQLYFPEFDNFRSDCKYADCLHYQEPTSDCAVKQNIGQPEGIMPERYEGYIKLLGDIVKP